MATREHTVSDLRVLIVDSHQVSRAAIRALLRTEGLDVVGDVSTLEAAVEIGEASAPDIVILDVGAGSASAGQAAGTLAQLRSMPTVLLTSSGPAEGDLDGFVFVAKRDICARRLRLALQPHTDSKEPSMSMQTYLDNVTAKTGKTPEELIELARADGVLAPGWKAGQLIEWLKQNYGLGHGHAMAVVATLKKQTEPQTAADEKIGRHFSGKKSTWRPAYDALLAAVKAFGTDTEVDPGATYLSLRKAGKKFAIVQVTTNRLDIGVKLKGAKAEGRLESAGSWNSMVTHRVRIHAPEELDTELLGWLERAYAAA
jgi:CheY-like chemotaxis protein